MDDLPASPRRRIPGHLWLRLAALAVLVAAGFALVRLTELGELLSEQRLKELVAEVRGVWWAPLLLIGLYSVLAPLGLPMSPLVVAGAVFGAFLGSIYNVTGLVLGAAASFWVAKLLGRGFVVHVAGNRLRRAERAFQRHGFWPLVQTRFLPLPFPVINFGAALAGVSPARFLASAVVGLVPSTVLHTFFISRLFVATGERLALVVTYAATFVVLNLAIGVPWMRDQWRRRRRYRQILARRASRGVRES